MGIFFFRDFDQGKAIKVGLIQPNFEPHNEKFEIDPLIQLDTMIHQMQTMADQGAELMVLPETALVDGVDESIPAKDRKFYRLAQFPLLFCTQVIKYYTVNLFREYHRVLQILFSPLRVISYGLQCSLANGYFLWKVIK